MEQDSQRRLSKVWEGVWAGEGSATPRSDSGLNSLEYWDYSVELECITGQQGDGHSAQFCQAEIQQYQYSVLISSNW